jgi:hypothetical protein
MEQAFAEPETEKKVEKKKFSDRFSFLKTTSLAALIGVIATLFTAFTSYNADRAANAIEENKRRMEQQRQDFEREKFSKEYLLNLQDKVSNNLANGKPDLAVALVLNEPPCTNARAKLANLLVNADYVSAAFEGPKAKTLQASINQLKEESRNADPDGGAPITCQIEDSERVIADMKANLEAVLASQKGSPFAVFDHRDEDLKAKLAVELTALAKLKQQLVRPSPVALNPPTDEAPAAAPGAPAPAPGQPVQAPAAPLTLNVGSSRGWDIDVFYCDGAASNFDNAEKVANKLVEQARAAKDLAPGFMLGRIRLRALGDESNSKSAYQVFGNEIRAEVSETEQGNALATFLAKSNAGSFAIRQSPLATPWYLSVFVCPAPPAVQQSLDIGKSLYDSVRR